MLEKKIHSIMSLVSRSTSTFSVAPAKKIPSSQVARSMSYVSESKVYRSSVKSDSKGSIRRRTTDETNILYSYTSPRLNAVRNSSLCRRPAIGPPNEKDKGKLTLVLDVDETLIHSRLSPNQNRYRQAEDRLENARACEEFKITLEDGETVWVNKRPGLDEFLKSVSDRYETVAYTAGLEEYAKPLLDWLDPHGTIFRHRLYRDSCLFIRGYYVKDLQKLNRSLDRTVLVDNNAFCFLPQLSNGIPISSFYDDPTDNALHVLNTFLKRLENERDVRPILNKSFNLQNLLREHREHIIG